MPKRKSKQKIPTLNRNSRLIIFAVGFAVVATAVLIKSFALEAPVNLDLGLLQNSNSNNQSTDKTPPTVPTNLRFSNLTNTSVTISWDASTDNTNVWEYKIYKDGVFSYLV